MKSERILSGHDVIDRSTPDYSECLAALQNAERTADTIMREVRPALSGERYFTTKEIMDRFRISRRAMQNYRDHGTIPFTSIGGIHLYPESKLDRLLESNYNLCELLSR